MPAPEGIWIGTHGEASLDGSACLPILERDERYVRADIAEAMIDDARRQALDLGHQLVLERQVAEAQRDRYHEALVEARSAVREVLPSVLGGACNEHDDALRAVIWAQRAEAAITRALSDGATAVEKSFPLSARELDDHDMPRIYVALSPEGLEHAAFSEAEIHAWTRCNGHRCDGGIRVVAYAPVNVLVPAS